MEYSINDVAINEYENKGGILINGEFFADPGYHNISLFINNDAAVSGIQYWSVGNGEKSIRHKFIIRKCFENVLIESLEVKIDDETVLNMGKEEIHQKTVSSDIFFHVDTFTLMDDDINVITGWAFSLNAYDLKYEVLNEKGKECETSVRKTFQQRIVEEGTIDRNRGMCGFVITFQGNHSRSYTLRIKDEVSNIDAPLSDASKEHQSTISEILHDLNRKNIQKGIKYFKRYGFRRFIRKVTGGIVEDPDYDAWFKRHRVTADELEKEKNTVFDYHPCISILVPTFNTPVPLLKEMIESVVGQSYPNWELCIADGSDEDNEARSVIREYEQKYKQIKVVYLNENYGISGNTNKALSLATGEFTALFDHDDVLEKNALYEIVNSLQDNNYDIVYTDEDKLNDSTGKFEDPNFKPDYNPDLFLSHNYITHFFCAKTDIIRKVGGFNSEYDGSQDYDLMLKCIENTSEDKIHHIPLCLYHWRMHEGSTAQDPKSKMYCYIAGQKALQAHLDRIGVKANVQMMPEPYWGLYHTTYSTDEDPLVSIVIPNCDHSDVLKTCIDSLFAVNDYQNFEVIVVENNSKQQETFDYYASLEAEHDNVHVIKWNEQGFNYAAINNFGVKQAKGELILLLNNDTEVIRADAMREMVGLALRKDVGAVGAKLLYADNTIQHAGVVIGFRGYAQHIFNDIDGINGYGYMMRAKINCDYSAVTAACLMTKKSLYEQVGGLDEQFKVACNDIDYCLKLGKIGKRVVYDANSVWHHYESKSRGYENSMEKVKRFDDEVRRWQDKWMDILLNGDPNYNPNFKIEDAPFTLL